MKLSKAFLAATASAFGLSLAACEQEGPAEKVGRQIDQSVSKVERKLEDAKETVNERLVEAGKDVDDAALTARVKTALLRAPGVEAMKIDVRSADGKVSLFGAVDSAKERELAQKATAAVDGVKSVDNRLVVVKGS